jgi:hypothetical protein
MRHLLETTRQDNEKLAKKILELTCAPSPDSSPHECPAAVLAGADAIVSHIEVNDHHGVGVLLARLFSECDNIVSIRSKDFYEGRQTFGAMHACVSHGNASRDAVFWKVLAALRGSTVKRVLCVPYFPDDALNAIALKELFGVPLCTFLMDDQNLTADGIPDSLMRELLAKSSLRLAISPELYAGYELKYGFKMSYMPPLVSNRFILPHVNQLPDAALRSKSAVIFGNIWGQRWIELLRRTVRDSGITLRWYNNGEFRFLSCTKEALADDGIVLQDGARDADEAMVELLRRAPFVVVPSGVLDDTDDRRFIAQLSLPSRIPYILATSQAPILVMGSPETAAARFVTAAGIGMVTPYDSAAFQKAVERISLPDVNLEMRRAALLIAMRFADVGGAEWLWQSLSRGEPVDARYEEMMPRQKPDFSRLIARFDRGITVDSAPVAGFGCGAK